MVVAEEKTVYVNIIAPSLLWLPVIITVLQHEC